MRKGYVHVYTGSGKGKTTAAFGLALRAAGAGLRVLIVQFMKKRRCSEHKAMERFSDCITIRLFGTGLILSGKPTAAARKKAEQGLAEVRKAYSSSDYELFILDEINVALHCGLLGMKDVLALIDKRPPSAELILTGRYADKKVMAKADLVTEMREIKHYFRKGVRARKGIEC
jgi:cob(I)alamin adenosyltransferase